MIVKLGDGNTNIFTFIDGQGKAGICFSPNGSGIVGASVPLEKEFTPLDEIENAFLFIVSSNPDSLDVLIDHLEKAKQHIVPVVTEGK